MQEYRKEIVAVLYDPEENKDELYLVKGKYTNGFDINEIPENFHYLCLVNNAESIEDVDLHYELNRELGRYELVYDNLTLSLLPNLKKYAQKLSANQKILIEESEDGKVSYYLTKKGILKKEGEKEKYLSFEEYYRDKTKYELENDIAILLDHIQKKDEKKKMKMGR